MKIKFYTIIRLYSGLTDIIINKTKNHNGSPALYNLIKIIDSDKNFDQEIIFLLDRETKKKIKYKKLKKKLFNSKITYLNYYVFNSNQKFIIKTEIIINKFLQYLFIFFKVKKNSIYYFGRDDISLANILNFKRGLIILRLLGITYKIYNLLFYKKNLLAKLLQRVFKLNNVISICTNDGSWAQKTKNKFRNKNFNLLFNGSNFKKEKYHCIIQKKLKILFVSRIEKFKGIDELLKLISLLKQKNIFFEVTIIGDGKYKSELSEKIQKLNLQNNVILIGKIENHKINNFLNKTDLFISLNHQGMFGNNVIEATSKGIPIVAADLKCLPEKEKNFFYIYKKNQVNDVINFILRFAKNYNIRKKYSKLSESFFLKNITNWKTRIDLEKKIILKNYSNIIK